MKSSSEIPSPKPTGPLTFPEAMYHYFKMEDALYDAKVRGTDIEWIEGLQGVVDALLAEITNGADENGFGKDFRSVIWNERRSEKITLWFRRTANKLKTAKPSLLSLELLGSAGIVIAVAYYVLHLDRWLSLFFGLVIVALRLSLPWVMDTIATRNERKMRELRGRYDSLYGAKVIK